MRDAEREAQIALSEMRQTSTPLALAESFYDQVVEDKNADGNERKRVNRIWRVELKHAQQVEDHQDCEDCPPYVHF